jgi:O-methyltransferase involved in polyketide biosynthesis
MRFMVVSRTMIFDWWIRQFLADHPNRTVVELGTGLNTRFERTDNGSVHWIDLDLPDTIELRRRFFADTAGSSAACRDVASGNSFHRRSGEPSPYPTASARMCSKISEVSV